MDPIRLTGAKVAHRARLRETPSRHLSREPPAGGRPAQTQTQPPFHFCPGTYYARLVEELRPLTYDLVGRKTKLMPKDQWSTILGHSPDVADALIQSMLLAS